MVSVRRAQQGPPAHNITVWKLVPWSSLGNILTAAPRSKYLFGILTPNQVKYPCPVSSIPSSCIDVLWSRVSRDDVTSREVQQTWRCSASRAVTFSRLRHCCPGYKPNKVPWFCTAGSTTVCHEGHAHTKHHSPASRKKMQSQNRISVRGFDGSGLALCLGEFVWTVIWRKI